MTAISAKIIADSISYGNRLTTMEVTFNRFILSEFNTHRLFSRNSASSRAIPIEKQIEKIKYDCAFPVEFGTNQSGMQAGPPLVGEKEQEARKIWQESADLAVEQANKLMELGVHKQITNRILEPFMWHTVIITATNFEGFFDQRMSKLAQPEIEVLAIEMFRVYNESKPKLLLKREYHLPYIQEDEFNKYDLYNLRKISAARCARVSYLTHDGKRDINKDLDLYNMLTTAKPPHWSPLEHVATPCTENVQNIHGVKYPKIGNFTGWVQLRHEDKFGIEWKIRI